MPDTQPEEWPDRRIEILVPTTILCILSTAVLLWRVTYGLSNKRKLLICDYLLIIAALMNITSTGIRFKSCYHGQGRHILDPSISKPHDILEYSYYLWLGQVINLIAVAVLKFSICAYLLALRFSRVYLGVVWASILMVTVFNLLIPTMSVFCHTPFEANWNKAVQGKCFLKVKGNSLAYTQGVSNVLTDIVYVVAPIIYLSTIQISRRTQWGLRIVFCLGLIATACSIVKTIELVALTKTRDPTWDGTNLMIWSSTELSVGILIASLPPLRKHFDALFRRILPSTLIGSKTRTRRGGDIQLYNISKSFTMGTRSAGRRSRSAGEGGADDDGDSERHILPENVPRGEITKTVVHEVRSERDVGVQVPVRSGSASRRDFV